MGSESSPQVPVLDFSDENSEPGTEKRVSTALKVRQALEEYGCFIVNYDKFPLELRDGVFSVMEELFQLPTETKMKNVRERTLNGYVCQDPKFPLLEGVGIEKANILQHARSFTNLMWPQGNDRFCENIYEYATLVSELDKKVTRMVFESYGVKEKHHEAYVGTTSYTLRLFKYKAAAGGCDEDEDEPSLGFVTHTDKSFTTILHQVQVKGLEVESRDGHKILVDFPSPSSFLVLAGDALMAWSNDRVLSPSHRVILSGKIDRYSLGLFAFNDGVLQVPEELVDEQHPLKYKPFDHLGLMRYFFTEEGYMSKCAVKSYCGL